MKIQILEATSKRPLANMKVQLQIKGKDSGFVSLTTDGSGNLTLDDKYNGQQIAVTNGQLGGTMGGQWTTATEGARLMTTTDLKQKTTETSQGGGSTFK